LFAKLLQKLFKKQANPNLPFNLKIDKYFFMTFFRIFSLHPGIFSSFFGNSLIAKAVEKNVINYEVCNWREKFGKGNYKQVDDKPYGGGDGMVLKIEPIFEALSSFKAISSLFEIPKSEQVHQRIFPNNHNFWQKCSNLGNLKNKQVTIHLTPRGFGINQNIIEWLSQNFETINLLCGRYEGFDSRISEIVDLELSIGDFVLNGGEVAAMSLIEAVSRLLPDFLVKTQSSKHDSFSSELNIYKEQKEFIIGKNKITQKIISKNSQIDKLLFDLDEEFSDSKNFFDNNFYLQKILPKIEHPQYTRPKIWNNYQIPPVLTEGNHKNVQDWRFKNWKK
jgi:tRNA (guanine37-N1)-methyltransferase